MLLVVFEHRPPNALAPPFRADKAKALVYAQPAALIEIPGHPAVSHHLPVNFSKQHIGIRVTVIEVLIAFLDVLGSISSLNLVGFASGGDDIRHALKINLAAKSPEG
jgi:hypothetical protein